MTEEQKPTAGTPDPDDTDAQATETGGTQEPDGRDGADEKSDDQAPLHLQWKAKAEKAAEAEERARRAEEEVERLRQERSGFQPAPGMAERAEREIDELAAENAELEADARAGNIAARAAIRANNSIIELRQDTLNALALMAVPETRRAQVLKTFDEDKRTGRNRFNSITEVDAAYQARDLKKRNQELEARVAEFEQKAKRNGDGTFKPAATTQVNKDDMVRTASRESPSPPNAKKPLTMTMDDWQSQKAELYALADEGDAAALRKVHEMQAKIRAREIVLRK